MKLVGLIFIFITYAVLKSMVSNEVAPTSTEFDVPTFPTYDLDVDGLYDFVGVSGFDAIEEATYNIAIAIGDTGKLLLANAVFIFNVMLYIGQLIFFIVANTFTGLGPQAPWYVNTIIVTPGLLMMGLIFYRLIRSGDDDA